MLKKYAESFYQLGSVLAILQVATGGSLKPRPPNVSPEALAAIPQEELDRIYAEATAQVGTTLIGAYIDDAEGHCTALDLKFSLKAIKRLRDTIAKPVSQEELKHEIDELNRRIRDELEERHLIYVSPPMVAHYDSFRAGWEDAITKFAIASDVEEAEKCFALERFTASVYHAMRVAETGVVALGAHFHLPAAILDKPWGDIVREIQAKVQGLPHGTVKEKDIQSKFAAIANDLFQVNLAWRIPAAHASRIPASKYTEAEAEDVLRRTKALMRHLYDAI